MTNILDKAKFFISHWPSNRKNFIWKHPRTPEDRPNPKKDISKLRSIVAVPKKVLGALKVFSCARIIVKIDKNKRYTNPFQFLQVFVFFWLVTYPPLLTFYLILVDKEMTFLTTYPPPLLNAVCERPLSWKKCRR